jgi:hypothetical protein
MAPLNPLIAETVLLLSKIKFSVSVSVPARFELMQCWDGSEARMVDWVVNSFSTAYGAETNGALL